MRSLNCTTSQTANYVGNCTYEGNQDGINALLNESSLLIYDLKNSGHILIIEADGTEKSMTATNRNVSYCGTVGHVVRGITQEAKTGGFFVSAAHAVGIFSYQTKTFTLIAGSTSSKGFQGDQFTEIQFDTPAGQTFLNSHTLLVSDISNHRLRVLDLISNTSYSICSGEWGDADGSFITCSLYLPVGLLILGDKIYVGDLQRIRIIEGMY